MGRRCLNLVSEGNDSRNTLPVKSEREKREERIFVKMKSKIFEKMIIDLINQHNLIIYNRQENYNN